MPQAEKNNFEREFFRLASEWLDARQILIPAAREAEGAMLGMYDQAGEMRLLCLEARQRLQEDQVGSCGPLPLITAR